MAVCRAVYLVEENSHRYRPGHSKLCHLRADKIKISTHIYAVWSISSRFTFEVSIDLLLLLFLLFLFAFLGWFSLLFCCCCCFVTVFQHELLYHHLWFGNGASTSRFASHARYISKSARIDLKANPSDKDVQSTNSCILINVQWR